MPNEIDELRAQLAQQKRMLAAFQTQGTTIKVSAKGGVSVYGLGRYPTTLYKSQWLKLLDMAEAIRDYIAVHDAELPLKGEAK